MFTMAKSALITTLGELIASTLGGGMGGTYPTVHLFKTAVTPTNVSVPGDFVEADYNGYAAVVLTHWNAAYWQSQGAAVTYSNQILFQPTDGLVTNTVYGYWLEVAGGDYLGAERFQTPWAAIDATSQLLLSVPWSVDDPGIPAVTY